MKRLAWFSGLVALAGLSMGVAGCGGGTTPGNDAAVLNDTGTPMGDGGVDTGPVDVDMGTPGTDGGSDAGSDAGMDAAVLTPRTTATNGSAIVLSADDTILVACNREAGSVSIFDVDPSTTPPTLGTPTELDFTGDEPWAAVMGNDDDTAYVILRRAQQVVAITDLHGTPTVGATHAATGSEPTGIAISPLGTTLWVANWGEGTVSRIATADLSIGGTVDLNAELVASGSLGTGVSTRPGLAHPRAIVITNDGDADEADESVYATEYFAQTRTDTLPSDDSQFDVERRGLVYRIDGGGTAHGTIPIMPIADTGFVDSNGATTGCYPNQLLSAALASGRLYVTAVCASPRGPTGPVVDAATGAVTNAANFKTQIHTGVFVVDVGTNTEIPAQHLLLTRAFQQRYDAMTVTDDGANRRIPLIANDIAFIASGTVAYVPGYGSDAVFRIQYNADGSFNQVGATAAHFINLSPAGTGMPVGRLPYGVAIGHVANSFAFTINEHSRNVSVISLASQTTVAAAQSTAPPTAGSPEANVLDGRRFFVTGLGRWSFRGQGWNSCEACHGDGLTDTVTWYFARGPRQSISLDGTFDSTDPTQQRLLNWTAIFDEIHDFENNTRGNSGGVGAVVHTVSTPAAAGDRIVFDGSPLQAGQMAAQHNCAGLNGSISTELMPTGTDTPHSAIADWDHVRDYVATIRSPRAPTTLVAADVSAGAALFAANNCAACHGTHMWTISRRFWTPDEAHNAGATGSLRAMTYTAPSAFPSVLNPPSMATGRTASIRFPAGATAAANDQIQCILRAVGTFPTTGSAPILPAGTTVALREVRQDMSTLAQGLSGYNPPSLLDSIASAPYFHGGNARTLEEAFSPTFAAHHTALAANFLETDTAADRATHVRQLVAFLLSIDESTAAPADPVLGYNPLLCPASL